MSTQRANWPRLRSLGLLSRIGLIFLILTLVGGYIISGIYLQWEYENRDEREGLTMTDIVGAYHGVSSPSPLLESLKSGHPEDLPDPDRQALIDWLESDRVSDDYDNLDLGDAAPSEIIAVSCLDCHTRGAEMGDGIGDRVPLDYFDDVQSIAISREVMPKNLKIVALSTHVHAPSLAMVLIVLVLLSAMTRWPSVLVGALGAAGGIGIFFDISGQWLARTDAFWAYAIVGGGFAMSMSVGLLGFLIIVDLLLPGAKAKPDTEANS
ncbi:MAG: hypothetical protein ACIARQ_11170 [Phycisphaerales bacterium JB061]